MMCFIFFNELAHSRLCTKKWIDSHSSGKSLFLEISELSTTVKWSDMMQKVEIYIHFFVLWQNM